MTASRWGDPRLLQVGGRQVRLTSPQKPMFPDLTKEQVVEYYLAVSDRMLDHLRGRPTALERWPDGVFVGCESFYQKHLPARVPDFVSGATVTFPSGRHGTMVCPTDPAAIVWAAQMNAITFHPWPSTSPATELPDQLRLDFDPSPGTGFADAAQAADLARGLVSQWDWPIGCKTSGGRGVHAYVPLEPKWTFVQVRHAAIAIGRELQRRAPDLITVSWWKEGRGERVFVDFNQAAQDRTIASAYSIRANPRATVSMPVSWEELPGCRPQDYTVASVPALLANPDPWISVVVRPERRADLAPALELWQQDVEAGLPDMPYPPEFPKMPGEPVRVQPSRAARRSRSTS
ncbi:MAG: non-homologous end-joining DNA ligase [Actinomycetales bacterium]